MLIRVRLFAIQREIAGTREVRLELDDGAAIEDAWVCLVEQFPRLAPGRSSVRFARNGEYAEATDRLVDGDELAFIPPVSGGAGESGAAETGERGGDEGAAAPDEGAERTDSRTRILELRDGPLDDRITVELANRLAREEDGAIVAFTGRTRSTPGTPAPGQEAEAALHEGRRVDALQYEAHESMALAQLGRIADEIEARFGVERLAIVHSVGLVALGEVSIVVVAASPHRDAAFEAARYAIDETKARAPIWKAERFADGHVWIGAPARSGPE